MNSPRTPPLWLVRTLVILVAVTGIDYVAWRWTSSVQWAVWWIAVPLVLAETYSLVDSLLFGLTMWRLRRRPDPPPAPDGLTVDVFITTYNESVELLEATVRAAERISYPHTTWILDDGSRPEVRQLAGSLGVGWLTRSPDWHGHNRHAKAGNLNNALLATNGEFVLILDADQIVAPDILDRTLGYFTDEQVGLVQTRQFFSNVPGSDPLGSQAPLFYGPIQQGKDAWNSAFFCGSNAVIRREALMRLGVTRYVADLERRIRRVLKDASSVIARARRHLPSDQSPLDWALRKVARAVHQARQAVDRGEPLADVTHRFQCQVATAAREVVERDTQGIVKDLASAEEPAEAVGTALDSATLDRLARRDLSPLGAIESVKELISSLDVDREDEAQPIMPMSVISVTEDLATCLRLHAAGWRSVYHDETLALGLAPEDVATMLTQRLRWAQGTIQVMIRENPLSLSGLTLAQRLMYFATMWSYLSGFAAVVYLAAPALFLGFGVLPVKALSTQFFLRLVPFLVVNLLLFLVIGWGRRCWRGQQYSLALFPVWIRAVTSAIGDVFFGRSLSFAVTPKDRQTGQGRLWRLVWLQLVAVALLLIAAVVGAARWATGSAAPLATAVCLAWIAVDLSLLLVIVPAARYRGFRSDDAVHPVARRGWPGVPAPRSAVDPPLVPIADSASTRPEASPYSEQESDQ